MGDYNPVRASEGFWKAHQEALVNLLALTAPTTDTDARHVLGQSLAFAIWASHATGVTDVGALFTHTLVDRYSAENPRRWSEGTHRSALGRLRRIVAAAQGEPPVTRRSERTGPSPYTKSELAQLSSTASPNSELRRFLGQAMDGTFAEKRRSEAWDQARETARVSGVGLDMRRLRCTAVLRCLAEDRSVVQIIRRHGLTRADLESVRSQAPVGDPADTARVMRG